ncbi:MAG: Phosphate-import protein PhnD [Syntrophomonadaceae bacterium]|nr:Phosphate-import protein PhnD [Bacillota bacterium]
MFRVICRLAMAFLILIIFFFLLGLTGCGQRQQYRKVRLSVDSPNAIEYNSPSSSKSGRAPLRVAIAPVISPKETIRSYDEFLTYLSAKLERPVELIQRQTYAEVNDLVRSGHIDVALVCTRAYVEGKRDFDMELLVAPQVQGQAVYYSYLIVPLDSEAQSLEDLRGKTFAFSDPMSTSGRLVPVYRLWQMGETPESFFKKYIYTYSHDNSMKAVAAKLVDGAAVDSLVYDYALARGFQYIARTKIIWKSPPYGAPPIVVHPRLNSELKTQLRDVFLTMDQDEEGRRILQDLMIDRFVVIDDAAYDSIREMIASLGHQG